MNTHHYFKRGYVEALCNTINLSRINNGEHSIAHQTILGQVAEAFRGKGWKWDELIDAGVTKHDLITLEQHKKAFGLGPRPILPPAE